MADVKTTKVPNEKADPTFRDESKVSNREKGAPPNSRKLKGDKR
jgi:hypothetical protein